MQRAGTHNQLCESHKKRRQQRAGPGTQESNARPSVPQRQLAFVCECLRTFQEWKSANNSVDTRTINIAAPTINSRVSLNISGFINSSLRIVAPEPLAMITSRQ